ncbi:hypothetical protein CY652_03310 [Burkholderia sp. WAC0059]|uniref:DUF2934 domain-containing protein n=1 Tax=Burkholderia sp. WAC0059 TaxID=2066022 RepID=UPI000C7EAE05|nr:DUF2934 domain-containing protein [Burkholderia sp. WAC0059]PLZ04009.1 hypothetical protein CY652_03310 [Burkholderia sp. WAC0059]
MDEQKEHLIRQRAYRLWQDAGAPEGRADEYWHRAEAQFNAEGEGEAAPPEPVVEQSGKRRAAGAPLEEGDTLPPAEATREKRRG